MLKQDGFWDVEKTAPLMLLNKGFLEKHGFDSVIERVSKWADILLDDEERKEAHAAKLLGVKVELTPDVDRIIIKDAERTFSGDEHRKKLAKFLGIVYQNFQDYHQGLSFATSFLLLFLPEYTTISILAKLNSNAKFVPGYWKHEAVDFARDAYVFNHLFQLKLPALFDHMSKNFILPETYCQKWFVALCIHVLPFDALFDFLEQFLKHGNRFLFQFGLSLLTELGDKIMATRDAAVIFGYLRLDAKTVKFDPDVPMKIVTKAKDQDISFLTDDELTKVRKEVYEKNLKVRFDALAKKKQEELEAAQAKKAREEARQRGEDVEDSDGSEEEDEEEEEGVDCQICHNMVPEYYCKDCDKLICGLCHQKKVAPHDKAHKVVEATQEIIDNVCDALAKLSLK